MVETKLNPQHGSMAERIANRLRNSGDVHHADVVTTHGTGPTRTNTNIHHSANHIRPRESGERK
jgi:hypothetical protein